MNRNPWNKPAPEPPRDDFLRRIERHPLDKRTKLSDGHYEKQDSERARREHYLDRMRRRDRTYDPDLNWWH